MVIVVVCVDAVGNEAVGNGWTPVVATTFASKEEAKKFVKDNIVERHVYHNNGLNYTTMACRAHVDCGHFVKIARLADGFGVFEQGEHSSTPNPEDASGEMWKAIDQLLATGALPASVHTQMAVCMIHALY